MKENQNNLELEEAREEITSLGFNPEEVISMVGLGHDWNSLLTYFRKHDVQPIHYFDIAYVLQHEKALAYVRRNNIEDSEVHKVNRVYQWKADGLERLLDSDIPIKKMENFIALGGSWLMEELFSRLEFEQGEFRLTEVDNSEDADVDTEKQLVHCLQKLNSDIDIKELVETLREKAKDCTEDMLDFELDEESEKKYNEIKGLQQFRSASKLRVKHLALNHFFNPEGVDFAIEQQVPVFYAFNVAKAYQEDAHTTRHLLQVFGPKNITLLIEAYRNLGSKEFRRLVEETQGKTANERARHLYYYSKLHEKAQKEFTKYLTDLPYEVHDDFIRTMRSGIFGNLNFELSHFALEKNLLGYVSRMPVIQISSSEKFLKKTQQILGRCYELEGTIRVKDVDFEDNAIKEAILDGAGNSKYLTVEDLVSISRKNKGYVSFKTKELADQIKGIHEKNIPLIANQVGVNEKDLRKALARAKQGSTYNLQKIEQAIHDFEQISNQAVDPRNYGLSKLVEGEFKVYPLEETSGLMGLEREFGFVMGLYPNPLVVEELAQQKKVLCSHHKDAIAYARCYVEGNTIRIEELQTDIYDKELRIPSSIRVKYSAWDRMLLSALEHFALGSGYTRIELTPSELQIRKWDNYQGMRGITAHKTYTQTPIRMGYHLEKTKLEYAESTGHGFLLEWRHGGKKEVGNVMWVKELKMGDLPVYERLLYQNEEEKRTREQCLNVKPIKREKNKLDYSQREYGFRKFDLFGAPSEK